MYNKIVEIVIEQAQEVNKTLQNKINLEKQEKAPLFGEIGVLDSIALVTMIVAIEQALEDEFDVPIVLADERAMSQKNSPYQSIETLANYANTLLREVAHE